MIKVRVTEITNISNQVVMIPYNPISTDSSVTDVDATASGILQLQPGTKFSIEESRLLDLKPLLRARVITVITRKIKAHKPVPYILNGVASAQGLSNASAVGDSESEPALEILGPAPGSGQVGVLYEFQPTLSKEVDNQIWNWDEPPPGWADLSTTTGKVSGYPDSPALYGLRIGCWVNGATESASFFWEVNVPF